MKTAWTKAEIATLKSLLREVAMRRYTKFTPPQLAIYRRRKIKLVVNRAKTPVKWRNYDV